MEIKIDSYSDWKSNVDTKSLPHFSYPKKSSYILIAFDGALSFIHDLGVNDVSDYETNYLPNANKKLGSFYQREPFAAKILPDGTKLFRRKHGVKETILANSSKEIIFTVPYTRAKINKLEVIDANSLDVIDMYVKSPIDANVAAAYGMPADYLLNQFGFGVVISNFLYSDKSDYDADVYSGFQIIVKYYNETNTDKQIGLNLIYHEVV